MLQTQVNYWANQEQKRHNLAQETVAQTEAAIKQYEADIKLQDSHTKQQEAETNRINALSKQREVDIARNRMETEYVNALTAQTEAATRQAAQTTNEMRLAQDYDIALRNLELGSYNAESTRTQAESAAYLNYMRGHQSEVETAYIPYSTGANIAGTLVNTGAKLLGPAKSAAKAVQSGIRSLMYNIRN